MINLLSPETKQNIRAARINVKLRLYVILSLAVAIGIVAIYGIGFYLIMNDKQIAEQQLLRDEQAVNSYDTVLAQAKEYKTNLSIAKKVLSTGTNYSDFLTSTAQSLPSGSILTSLTLSNLGAASTTTPGGGANAGGIILLARTTSYGGALQLKESLETSDMFENVSLADVTKHEITPETTAIEKKYPFTLSVNVTISKPKAGV